MNSTASSRKYQRLLNASIELFIKYGYRNLGVEQIASAAGISKVTLYKHFPSKEDLFLHCVRIITDLHYEKLQERLSLEETSMGKITAMFEFNLQQRHHYSDVFIQDIMGTEHIWKQIKPYREKMARELCSTILYEGEQRGEFRICSIPLTIDLLMSFSSVISQLYPYTDPGAAAVFLKNLYGFLKGALTGQESKEA